MNVNYKTPSGKETHGGTIVIREVEDTAGVTTAVKNTWQLALKLLLANVLIAFVPVVHLSLFVIAPATLIGIVVIFVKNMKTNDIQTVVAGTCPECSIDGALFPESLQSDGYPDKVYCKDCSVICLVVPI